ncbi:hypothetical protein ACH4VR_40180 [Streptomyces sp. NPDC020883]|uniref:hypothetical protein n=1 Tax=Streptomyces sp. NPDC020883 TaxID=3365099 RepID=UPI0037B1B7E4
MANTKKHLGSRLPEDAVELAGRRAADLKMSVGDYVAGLIHADAEGLRPRAMASAERFLADHQALFDEAEDSAKSTKKGIRAA